MQWSINLVRQYSIREPSTTIDKQNFKMLYLQCILWLKERANRSDHKDNIHRIADYLTAVTSAAAERIVNRILYAFKDGGILGVAVIDRKGNILSAKSVESFKETFRIARVEEDYGGALAIATLSVVNQIKDIFGEPQSIITVHKNCK